MSGRPSIPKDVADEILIETGHRCAVCGVPCPLERTHIIPWHKSKDHSAQNLICLCANCHQRADNEKWGAKALREYKLRPWIERQNKYPTPSGATTRVEMIIEMEFRDFDEHEEDKIRYALAGFLRISPSSIRIVSKEEGSVKLIIDLPISSAEKLLTEYEANILNLLNHFASFSIKGIREIRYAPKKESSLDLPTIPGKQVVGDKSKYYRCFLMMDFTEKEQDILFEQIKESIDRFNKVGNHFIELNREHTYPPLAITSLEYDLKQRIEMTDFAIAEISKPNPDVLFEIGYAVGINKPLIIMVRKDVDIPTDFHQRQYSREIQIIRYSTSEFNLIPQLLQKSLKITIDYLLEQKINTTYSAKVYENLSVSDLKMTLIEAKDKVDILATNLTSIVNLGLSHIIKERLSRCPNLRVRMLTLDPKSDFCAKRAMQLGFSVRNFKDQLIHSIKEIVNEFMGYFEQVKIATYNEFPTQVVFRIDDTVYINIISANQQSRNNICFKLRATNIGVASSILNNFDTLWSRSNMKTKELTE